MTDKVATATTYAASGAAVILSTINSYAAAIGIFIAVLTLAMNFWFKWQHLQLAKKKRSTDALKEELGGDE